MESISSNLPALPKDPTESQIAKLMSDLERVTKEKQSLERENLAIEKDLKKSNDVILRSKEKNCIQMLLEENAKLRDEADTLFGEKAQNDALKTQIYSLSMKDDFKKVSPEEALSPIKNGTHLTAEIQVLKAEKQAAEELIKQMRSDRNKLEMQLRNQSLDLQEIKSQFEPDKKKFWWGKGGASQPTAQSLAPTQTVDSSDLSLAIHSSDKNSHANLSAPIEPVQVTKSEVAAVQAPVASSGVRSWWGGKSAAPAAGVVQSKTEASTVNTIPVPSANVELVNQSFNNSTLVNSIPQQQLSQLQTEIATIKEERNKLQKDLEDICRQAQDQKQIYELQIQNEKKKTVEAEQKIQEAYSESENLKKSIYQLRDKSEDLEIKLKQLSETSQKSNELQLLQQRHDLDIQKLKDSKEKESEAHIKTLKDKISLLEESLILASSSDSDLIQNLEAKYNNIIQEKENEIKSNNAENQIKIQAFIKKNEEELNSVRQSLETKYNSLIQENEKQLKSSNEEYEKQLQSVTKQHDEELQSVKQSLNAKYNDLIQEKEQRIMSNNNENGNQIKEIVNTHEKELNTEIEALEAKYCIFILQKEQQIRILNEENQVKIQNLLKKHEEELVSSRKFADTQDETTLAELQAQIDKLNQLKKELNEIIGKKDAELLQFNQKHQTEKQKLQNDFDEKLKKSTSSFEEKIRVEKSEAAENIKKEKNDWDVHSKKEKRDLEDKFNKEKHMLISETETKKKEISNLENIKNDLTKKLEKANADLDKLKKDSAAIESQKSECIKKLEKELSSNKDELNKSQAKIKSLETENTQLKADKQKTAEALEKKLKDTQSTFESKLHDYEQMKEEKTKFASKIVELNESIKRLESAQQTQNAEYEVLKSSYDRATKLNQEKDENIKKLKAKSDELTKSENSLKKSIAKTEKEKEDVEKQLEEAKNGIKTSETRIQQLQDELTNFGNNSKQYTEQFSIIENEKNELISKIEYLEKDYKLADRKNAIMIKDLQKQLLKERKKYDDDSHSQNDDLRNSANSNLNETKKTEFKLADQDNQALKKNIRASDEQIKSLNEKITKLLEESENKSKTIRQYILRDNASKLMPDDRSSNKGFNMNVLSSGAAISKMDPAILTEINLKMQKLLEELTLRIQTLESQIEQF